MRPKRDQLCGRQPDSGNEFLRTKYWGLPGFASRYDRGRIASAQKVLRKRILFGLALVALVIIGLLIWWPRQSVHRRAQGLGRILNSGAWAGIAEYASQPLLSSGTVTLEQLEEFTRTLMEPESAGMRVTVSPYNAYFPAVPDKEGAEEIFVYKIVWRGGTKTASARFYRHPDGAFRTDIQSLFRGILAATSFSERNYFERFDRALAKVGAESIGGERSVISRERIALYLKGTIPFTDVAERAER